MNSLTKEIPSTPPTTENCELTSAMMLEKMKDPKYLPSYATLNSIISKISRSPYEKEHKAWIDFTNIEGAEVFEIWTEEYIAELSSYLVKNIEQLGGTRENPTVILEVGAGNGRLTHFLQEKLHQHIPERFKIIATDSMERNLNTAFPVEHLPQDLSLVQHNPQIVICSWMPYKSDFTSSFRACESVEQYILIGEENGCCGHNWLTWGRSDSRENDQKRRPYEEDGFTQLDHKYEHSKDGLYFGPQLSRIEISGLSGFTTTVVFKRNEKD